MTECLNCSLGTFQHHGTNSGKRPDKCESCRVGQFQDEAGASSCKPCPPGKYGNQPGRTSEDNCKDLPPGYFSKVEGLDGNFENNKNVQLCAPGKFGSTSGGEASDVACELCASGRFTDKNGEDECEPCQHGFAATADRTQCVADLTVIGAKLGNGAFGEVNQGTLKVGKADLPIAVKHVLESKATDAQRQDTIVECRLQCELESPFVVKCFGFASYPGPGDFSILLELMDLGDLPGYMESVVQEGGRIAEATRLRWMIEVAAALEYMHASNLIHADVSARNLVLCHSKTGVSCKLTDFGLSHAIDPSEQAYLLPRGQPVPLRWMAPECLPCDANFASWTDSGNSNIGGGGGGGGGGNGRGPKVNQILRLTPANDVWGFGVTLWEIEGLAANGELTEPLGEVSIDTLYKDLVSKKAKLDFKSWTRRDKVIDTFKDPAEVALKSCLRVRPWARATMTDIRRRLQAAAHCDAKEWEQNEINQWLDRMGAPRVDGADLWDIDEYELLMEEILSDDTRPEYMAQLKQGIAGEMLLPLSNRLGGELAGISELSAFMEGDSWPRGNIGGHPERFTWMMTGIAKQRDNNK
eukprot:g4481.t1